MRKNTYWIFLITGVLLPLTKLVAQTTDSFQPSTKDAHFSQASPNTNNGSSGAMEIFPTSGDRRRGIVHFDISSIPSGSTIHWATLTLRTSGTGGITRTINVNRVTRSWTEGTVTWNTPWTSSGGDFNATATDGTSVAWSGTTNEAITWDVASDIQNFVDGTYSNYGWIIKDAAENSGSGWWSFHSKESGTSSYRPQLQINYSTSGLPVEMVFFEARQERSGVELNWITATEVNNDEFKIEKKSDNLKDWEIIGAVKGHGTSYFSNRYEFIDPQPVSGVNYYRLKQIDFDGVSEYSDIVAVDVHGLFTHQVYPIPANDILHVVYNHCDQPVDVEIWNQFASKPAIHLNLEANHASINTEILSTGIYYMKLGCGVDSETYKIPVVR